MTMLKRIPRERAARLIAEARRLPQSDPATRYPAWYLHRWHFLPEGYLSRRSAAGYDRGIRQLYNAGVEQELIKKLTHRIAAARPPSVIELGCGPGRLLTALADSRVARRIVGVDLSPYLLERAQHRLGPCDVTLMHADATEMYFTRIVRRHQPSGFEIHDYVLTYKKRPEDFLLASHALRMLVHPSGKTADGDIQRDSAAAHNRGDLAMGHCPMVIFGAATSRRGGAGAAACRGFVGFFGLSGPSSG